MSRLMSRLMSREALLFLSRVRNRSRPTESVAFIFLTSFRYIETWCFDFIIDEDCCWFSDDIRLSRASIRLFMYCVFSSRPRMCTWGELVIMWPPNLVPWLSTFAEIELLFTTVRGVCWILLCLPPSLITSSCLFGWTNFFLGVVYLIYRLLFETLLIGYQ